MTSCDHCAIIQSQFGIVSIVGIHKHIADITTINSQGDFSTGEDMGTVSVVAFFRKSGTGNDSRQNAWNPDIPDNSHICGSTFLG